MRTDLPLPTLRRSRWPRRISVALLVLGAAWLLLPRVPLLEGVPFSRMAIDRNGDLLRITLAADGRYRLYAPLGKISARLVAATLRREDRHFEEHGGINPVSTARAAWHFLTGHAHGGASTITMQVARLRFHLQTRTIAGKLRQMAYALAIERHYSKEQILEAYLNLAPYGGNIEGAGAAAELYLGKAPRVLTWPEAVSLSVIPQSPAWRAPRIDGENPALTRAHQLFYDQLSAEGVIPDPLGRAYALTRPAPAEPAAPQFVEAALERDAESPLIRTTIDLPTQELVAKTVRAYVRRLADRGVRNAAALLVDTHGGQILASVGSADFSDAAIDGQVDGTRSPRSPGSALKPFIYALALDQGLIHPHSLLIDAPHRFGGYNPENFDRDFAGPISATEALARSRNVPAVDLTAELAQPTFYEFLARTGLPLRPEKDYGLSIALGSEEITMEQMAALYTMLANDGLYRPLVRTIPAEESTAPPPLRLVSREAAFLTLEMLANVPAPNRLDAAETRSIFWKTGTSHGFRDAWCAAVFDHYALVVWLGNFDGAANPALVGRDCAGPLLFGIIDAMTRRGQVHLGPHLPPPGANLRRVELCAISGQLPGPHCPRCESGWFIPGVSPIATCTVHREVIIDSETGLRLPSPDPARPYRREVREFWDSHLLALFEKAGLPRPVPPPFAPGTPGVLALGREGRAPRIVSPAAREALSAGPIPLAAEAEADVAKLYWFAGRRFLGSTAPREPLLWAGANGAWDITVLDDQGRSASRRLDIAPPPAGSAVASHTPR